MALRDDGRLMESERRRAGLSSCFFELTHDWPIHRICESDGREVLAHGFFEIRVDERTLEFDRDPLV